MENYLEKWNPLEIISMNAEENYRKLAIVRTNEKIFLMSLKYLLRN